VLWAVSRRGRIAPAAGELPRAEVRGLSAG
jgi:hypothetical protein